MAVDMSALLRSNEEGKKKADQFLRERYGVTTKEPEVNLSALIPKPQNVVNPIAYGVNAVNTALLPKMVTEAGKAASQLAGQPKPVNWQTRPYWQPWEEDEYNGLTDAKSRIGGTEEATYTNELEKLRMDNSLSQEEYQKRLAELQANDPFAQNREKISTLEQSKVKAHQRDAVSPYEGVMSLPDFAEHAEAAKGGIKTQQEYFSQYGNATESAKNVKIENPVYYQWLNREQTINGNKERSSSLSVPYMTENEMNVYNYYFSKYGKQKADEYYKKLEPILYDRSFEESDRIIREEMPDYAKVVLPILTDMVAPFAFTENAFNVLRGAETDSNRGINSLVRLGGVAQQDVLKDAGPLGQFLGNIGYSIVNMGTKLPFGPVGGLAYMSASAAGHTTADALERGADSKTALMLGALSGAIELATEKLPLDNLFKVAKQGGRQSVTQAVKGIFKQAGIEATEETVSEYTNTIVDMALMGEQSEYMLYKNSLLEQGMSETEATKLANLKFFVENPFVAAAGGAVSGGFFGTGASVINAAKNGMALSTYRNIVLPDGKTVQVQVDENGNPVETSQNVAQSTSGESNVISPIAAENAPVNGTEARSVGYIPLTQVDLNEYMRTGRRQSTRNEKARMLERGESPILTSKAEIAGFVSNSIEGNTKQTIKAYGKVGNRLANEVASVSNGAIDISGKYLELGSDDLRHSFSEHQTPKENGDIPLSKKHYENITDYIDDFDDIIYAIKLPNNSIKIQLGKKINGYSIITEVVSNERNSVRVKNMWGVSTQKYLNRYKNRSKSNGNRATAQQPLSVSQFPSANNTSASTPIIPNSSQNSNRVFAPGITSTVENGQNVSWTETQKDGVTNPAKAFEEKWGIKTKVVTPNTESSATAFLKDGMVYLNADKVNTFYGALSKIAHEATHAVENTSAWNEIKKAAAAYYRAVDPNLRPSVMREAVRERYKGVAELTGNQAAAEVVAGFIEDICAQDSKVGERASRILLEKSPNGFKRVVQFLKDKVESLKAYMPVGTGLSKQQRYALQAAQRGLRHLEKALKAYRKGKAEAVQGTKYSYAGRNADTADIFRLNEAIDNESWGMNGGQNRRQTGWFKGKDGMWRFEIDDSKAKYIPDGGYTLGDILKHDALYEAYPGLKSIRVRVDNNMKELGRFNSEKNEIAYRSNRNNNDILKTLIHEVQHAIQSEESFTRGGSSPYGYKILFNQYFDAASHDPEYQKLTNAGDRLDFINKYIEEQNGGENIDILSRRVYHNLYGEQEARDVMARINLSPEDRRLIIPFSGNKSSVITNRDAQMYMLEKNLQKIGLSKDEISQIIDERDGDRDGRDGYIKEDWADTRSIGDLRLGQYGRGYERSTGDRPTRETGGPKYSYGKGSFTDYYLEFLNKKYGTIPKGENAYREISVPKRTSDGTKTRQGVRTILEAKSTPDSMVDPLKEEIVKEAYAYKVISDKSSQAYAEREIQMRGFDGAMDRWNAVVNGEAVATKNNLSLGEKLMVEAGKAGDVETFTRIAAEISAEATRAGQVVQAMRLIKKMAPEGRLYYLQKSVDTIQKGLDKRLKNKSPEIEIPAELGKKLLEAKTESEIKAAEDEIISSIANQTPSTWIDKWNAWRYMAMLANPRTHIRNILGNTVFIPARAMKNAVAMVAERGIKQESRTQAILTKADKGLLDYAKQDFELAREIITGTGKMNPSTRINELRPIFKTKWLETVRKFNNKALDAEDIIFLRKAYVRSFAKAMKARGITVDFLNSNTVEAKKALNSIRETATQEAQEATYHDLSKTANALNRFKNTNAVTNVIGNSLFAFTKTPINVLKRGVEYSPIGLAKGIVDMTYGVKHGKLTSTQAVNNLCKGISGLGITLLGGLLSSMGLLVAGGSDDKREKGFETLQGAKNYALKIGDVYYTIDWMAPVALPLFTGAEIQKACEGEGFDIGNIADSLTKISEPMFNLSMLDGINSAFKSISYSDGNYLTDFAIQATTDYLSQALPTLGGQIARTIDPTARNSYYIDKKSPIPPAVQKFLNTAQAKIPFLSFFLSPKIDQWGRTSVKENVLVRAFENFISPGYISTRNETPVDKEIAKIYKETGETSILPKNADKYFTVDGETNRLSAKEYTEYAQERGQRSFKYINELLSNSDYQKLNADEKVEVIQLMYQVANAEAKKEVEPDYDIPKTVIKAYEANKQAGILYGDYYLYKMGLDSNPNQREVIEALNKTGLSKSQKQFLFEQRFPKSKRKPFG